MIKCLRSISCFLLLSVAVSSCSTKQYITRTHGEPLLQTDSLKSTRYNLSFKFRSNENSGLLVAKKMNACEIRIVATTLFGMSLFDFGLRKDSMHVYNCIEPLKKKKALRILENDFRLLFTDDKRIEKVEKTENKLNFVTGKFMSRTVVSVSSPDSLNNVEIRHPWIKLTLNLEKIDNGSTQ